MALVPYFMRCLVFDWFLSGKIHCALVTLMSLLVAIILLEHSYEDLIFYLTY